MTALWRGERILNFIRCKIRRNDVTRPRWQKLTLARISLCENSILRFVFTRICAIPIRRESLSQWDRKIPVCITYSDDSELSLRAQMCLRHKAQCTERHGERIKDLKRKQMYTCARHTYIFAGRVIRGMRRRDIVTHH